MFSDEFSIQICKIGGPFVLFICSPTLIAICIHLVQKETAAGQVITTKAIVEMVLWNLFGLIVGIIACRVGYGWFGGNKKQ